MSDRDLSRPDDLLPGLLGPGEAELSCDECFERIDRHVELQLAGLDADGAVPGMRAHLEGCPACREDHDALVAWLAAQPDRGT